jgi:hypothetical protein
MVLTSTRRLLGRNEVVEYQYFSLIIASLIIRGKASFHSRKMPTCAVSPRLRGAKVPALRERSPFGAGSSPQGFVLLAQSFSSGLAAKAHT